MNTIQINDSAKKVIQEDGIKTFPNECCGFLYGKDGEIRSIDLAIPVINDKEGDQRRRFEISPLDYMKAEKYALENDLDLLGIYHSHPNHPAIASEHDLAKAMPFFSYVIISIRNGEAHEIQSWRLKDSERIFEEEKVFLPQENSVI